MYDFDPMAQQGNMQQKKRSLSDWLNQGQQGVDNMAGGYINDVNDWTKGMQQQYKGAPPIIGAGLGGIGAAAAGGLQKLQEGIGGAINKGGLAMKLLGL